MKQCCVYEIQEIDKKIFQTEGLPGYVCHQKGIV